MLLLVLRLKFCDLSFQDRWPESQFGASLSQQKLEGQDAKLAARQPGSQPVSQ